MPRPVPLWVDDDHVVLGDVRLRVVDWAAHFRGDPPRPLDLRKPRDLVEAYAEVLPDPLTVPDDAVVVVEMGLHTSGSAAYLLAALPGATVVTVDLSPDPVPELAVLAASLGAVHRLHVLQPLDQTDPRLAERIEEAVGGRPLHLVIDDASHREGPTRCSFEALFPRVAPGGRYLIEDWAQAIPWGTALLSALADHPHRVGEIEAAMLAMREGGPSAMVHASLAPWLAAAMDDPTLPHHAAVQRWCRDPAGRDDRYRQELLRWLREPVDQSPLARLALELTGAVLVRPDVVASVRVTRHWIEVERGPAVLDPAAFTWADVAGDPLGMLRRTGRRSGRRQDGSEGLEVDPSEGSPAVRT